MKKWAVVWAGALVGVLVLSGIAPITVNVMGAIPIPHNSWGHPFDETGAIFGIDEKLTSWVDGVEYGSNLTFTSGPDVWFNIDTAGDWMTGPGDPNTPWRKEGGNLGDPIMYVWGDVTNIKLDPGGDGILDYGVFEEYDLWWTTAVNYTDLNLTALADQPPLFPKISQIIPEPADGLADYVLIYTEDPFFPMDQFYLEKNDGSLYGPIQTLTGVSNATAYFYASLKDIDLDGCGDELKLVWNNTGPGFGGNDIIVDRVEWNATSGGTHYDEPDNTIMTDAQTPACGASNFALRRKGTFPIYDQDTNDNTNDFVIDTPWPRAAINPPSITILRPLAGEALTGGFTETLSWLAYDDNARNDMLSFWMNYSLNDTGPWFVASLSLVQPFSGWGDVLTPMSVNWSVPFANTTEARISVCAVNPIQMVTCVTSERFTIDSSSPKAFPKINGRDYVKFYIGETIGFQIWADVSDDRMIAGAVYTIGRGNFPGYPLAASDGLFDEMNEVVREYSPQLPPPPYPTIGTYEYCVYAFDEAGNMNQESCVVLELTNNVSDEDTVAPNPPDFTSISASPDFNTLYIDQSTSTDVWLYSLYYSNDYQGLYSLLEEWRASDLPTSYDHSGAGSNSPDDFYYRLSAADTHMNLATSGVAAKINVGLVAGTQSLALPVINDNPAHLSQISGNFNVIHYFDPTDAVDPWKSISKDKPYQDFQELEFGRGYWIDMTVADTIVAVGDVPSSITYDLIAGWNLIGYSSPYARLVGDALSGISEYKVEGISDVEPYHLQRMTDSSVMEPFQAYWIWVPSDTVWVLTN
ncbi:MAG: hypothetical protein V3U51_02460 [Thermoplasmata archaeon]